MPTASLRLRSRSRATWCHTGVDPGVRDFYPDAEKPALGQYYSTDSLTLQIPLHFWGTIELFSEITGFCGNQIRVIRVIRGLLVLILSRIE